MVTFGNDRKDELYFIRWRMMYHELIDLVIHGLCIFENLSDVYVKDDSVVCISRWLNIDLICLVINFSDN